MPSRVNPYHRAAPGLVLYHRSRLCVHRLTAVPEVLYSIPSLEIILASDNQIAEIPVERLRQLARLATLDLRNNSIGHVPAKLGYMEQLRWAGEGERVPGAGERRGGVSPRHGRLSRPHHSPLA